MTVRKILVSSALLFLKALLVIGIVIGIYRFGGYAYEFGHSLYDNEAMSDPPGKDVAIVIPEGASVENIARLLESRGLIKDQLVFRAQERLSKYHGQLQAGNYVLNTSQYAEQMLAVLSGNEEDIRTEGEKE